MNNQKQSGSLRLGMILLILLVVLIYCCVFLASAYLLGFAKKTNDITFDSYDSTVEKRAEIIRSDLENWADIDYVCDKATAKIVAQLNSSDKDLSNFGSNSELSEMTSNLEESLEQLIAAKNVTGAFVVINSDKFPKSGLPGIYIERNQDKSFVLKKGVRNGINYGFFDVSSDVGTEYFNKPYYMSKENNYSGFWASPFTMFEDEKPVVTYTLPMISKKYGFLGVIGISADVDKLLELLPADELGNAEYSGYILSCNSSVGYIAEMPICSNQDNYGKFAGTELIADYAHGNNTYVIGGSTETGDYAFPHKISVSDPNKSYQGAAWSLTGVVGRDYAGKWIDEIGQLIKISLALSLLCAIVIAIVAGNAFVKPIYSLTSSVRQLDVTKPSILKMTRYSEINQLAETIENYSEECSKSTAKLSTIVDLLGIPFASFEKNECSNKVSVTRSMSDLLPINPASIVNGYISLSEWNEVYGELTNPGNVSYDGCYHINRNSDDEKWLKVRTYTSEGKTVGVIIDVTEEIFKRKQLEYERDYDVLTGIMNRRAFNSFAEKRIDYGTINSGAIIMWDLENLKAVNDTYGHLIGDKFIREAALALSSCDNPKRVQTARLSGDEFVTFIFGDETVDECRVITEEIATALRNVKVPTGSGDDITIVASAGISFYPTDAKTSKELIKVADYVMYQAKDKDVSNAVNIFSTVPFTKKVITEDDLTSPL